MPEAGGVVTWPFSWVADAALGIKILASRQDAQWLDAKTIIENLLCRDGQNAAAADIDWGGFHITNLGTPANGTDAANKDYVDSVAVEWKGPVILSLTWIDANTFRINNADYTSLLATGMRLKIQHNGGATTSYATVLLAQFSSPNTEVDVKVDGGVALVAPVVAFFYSQLSPESQSLPVWTYIAVQPFNVGYSSQNLSSGFNVMAQLSADLMGGAVLDTLGEFNTDYAAGFQPKVSGWYEFWGQYSINFPVPGAVTTAFGVSIYKNGVLLTSEGLKMKGTEDPALNGSFTPVRSWHALLQLVAGDQIRVGLEGSYAGSAAEADYSWFCKRVA